MSSGVIYVSAPSYEQARFWARENGWTKWKFISGPHVLRGVRDPDIRRVVARS